MANKMCVCMVWEEELGREWVGGLKKVYMEMISEQSCEQKGIFFMLWGASIRRSRI